MNWTIRPASIADLDCLMQIFDHARNFMRANGNPNQWIDGYPQRKLVAEEIANGHCHVCEDETGKVRGTFCFASGPDPSYARINDGAWLDDTPYGVIHRIASDGSCKGIFTACVAWCLTKSTNLRADTHADNKVMQHLLLKNGFTRCGIIYVANGTPRIAFQRTGKQTKSD